MTEILSGCHKIAICGFTEHKRFVPWDDDEWAVFAMNNLHTVIPAEQTARCKAWFNLHSRVSSERDTVHTEWAKQTDIPYYTFEVWDGYKSSRVFPASELCAKYGSTYFTNSVSWILAFAMATLEPDLVAWREGRDTADDVEVWDRDMQPCIGIWGVDMASGTEYENQRPSCEYFMGIGHGLGYKITVAEGSDLLKAASMYGIGDDAPIRNKMEFRIAEHQERVGDLNRRRQELANEIGQVDAQINQFQGAIGELNYFHGVWTQVAAKRDTDGT